MINSFLSIDQIKAIYVKLAGFYSSFCHHILKVEVLQKIDPDIRDKLIGLEKYFEELLQRALDQIRVENIDENNIWECRLCKRQTFVIENDINTCYLCHNAENVLECEECHEFVYLDEIEEIYTVHFCFKPN